MPTGNADELPYASPIAVYSPGKAAGMPGRRWRWLSRPEGRIAALAALLGGFTLAVLGTLAARGGTLPGGGALPGGAVRLGGAPLPAGTGYLYTGALVLAFLAAEGFVVHVRTRRGSHGISLSEIPMVLALLGLDPLLAIAARLLGGGAGLALIRRHRGVKLWFNTAAVGAQSSVAAATFVLLSGGTPPDGGRADARLWLAMYAAMILSDIAGVVMITAAIGLHDDPAEWRHLFKALAGVPLVAIATTIALLYDLAARNDQWVVLLLVAISVLLFMAYRAYVQQSHGHAQVRELYAFTRALDGSHGFEQVARVVLEQARDQLRAETAELIAPSLDGKPATRTRMSGTGEPVIAEVDLAHDTTARDATAADTTARDATAGDAWWQPALHGREVLLPASSTGRLKGNRPGHGAPDAEPADGMAVPVAWSGQTGVLLVRDSMADIGTFDENALRLFQALANHAGIALANVALVDRLRREAGEKEYLALHDPMTGLPNRRHFQQLLDDALSAALHDSSGPAVIQLDLDRFKEVNDALGHETGDSVLREVGSRLRELVEGRGRLARLGGDEFAVLLPRVHNATEALDIATHLARDLERPVQLGPLSLNPRASVGVAVAPVHGDDAQTLLRRADVAMYAAKGGRTGVRLYLPEDDQNTPHRLALIADLGTAIQQRELLVVFQPKLDPNTGAVTGAEALSRWRHPRHGNVPPDVFVPLAEHSGLVRSLTVHVLEVALRHRANWHRQGHDLTVAVNLSPSSLQDPSLPEEVSRLLAEAGVPAPALTLEITESSLMEDQTGSLATLDRLQALGIRLSIDDFGTGYSSLGRLRHLPIHEVKIDKSFVQRVAVDHRDRAVVRSAVQLGHALGLEVVAEGVEDQDTYAYLSREGCNLVQGYLISKPLPPDDFLSWLISHRADNVVYHRFTA